MELEIRIEERLAEIETLKKHVETQEKREKELEEEINSK